MPLTPYYNENELLQLFLHGDEHAFKKIYEQYSPRIYGNLLKLVKSEILARELLQDTFVKLWENRKAIDPDKSFRSYLFRIAENLVYDFFRRVSRDKKLQSELIAVASEGYVEIEEQLFHIQDTALLQKAIESLPPQRQLVFKLCKIERKSYHEVSEQLNISKSTISDHIVKATRSVREYLEEHSEMLLGFIACSILTDL